MAFSMLLIACALITTQFGEPHEQCSLRVFIGVYIIIHTHYYVLEHQNNVWQYTAMTVRWIERRSRKKEMSEIAQLAQITLRAIFTLFWTRQLMGINDGNFFFDRNFWYEIIVIIFFCKKFFMEFFNLNFSINFFFFKIWKISYSFQNFMFIRKFHIHSKIFLFQLRNFLHLWKILKDSEKIQWFFRKWKFSIKNIPSKIFHQK